MDQSLLRRLAFIKYLAKTSDSQSRQPAPLSCAALLTMHDAVEIFLQLASEHLNAGAERPNFMDYWNLLAKPLNREMEQKESMRRLNKSRVAMKHHGTLPSQMDIESFRVSTMAFFTDNTPLVFGLAFESISMFEYVNPESARDILKLADADLASMNVLDALDKAAVAFDAMLRDYDNRKKNQFRHSPFDLGPDLTFHSSFFMGLRDDNLGPFVDKIREKFDAIEEAIKIIACGIDYRQYCKFRELTPKVVHTQDGRHICTRRFSNDNAPSVESARFCMNFVVECAIVLREFDYSFNDIHK